MVKWICGRGHPAAAAAVTPRQWERAGGKAAGAINDSQNDFHTRLTRALQEHVKATIAPFKYPRSVIFTKGLPKTESGKIQRFRLRPGRDDTQDQTGRNQKGDMT